MINKILIAINSKLPFGLAMKRLKCIDNGHKENKSWAIEKHVFEKHPQNDDRFVYVSNLVICSNCGLHFHDNGMEFRVKPWDAQAIAKAEATT